LGLEATSRYSEPLSQFLSAQGYTLCLLHPRQTHPFAEQRGLRATTDQMSATTIARLLLSGEARPGYVPDELITTYREMERLHSPLADESARYQNQIQALLVVLFPEFVQVFADPCRPTALALLRRSPSAKAISAAGVEVITASLRELAPRRYGRRTAQQLVSLATQSSASGLATDARALSLQILCDQLQHPLANLARIEPELDQLLDRDTGASGLKSPPEFGRKTVAVLRAELGDVSRYEPRRSGRSVCWPGPGGQAERQVERPGQAFQTWQRASASRALSGGLALDLLAGVGLRCLLPAPGRPWPQSP
jgi:transposase